MPTWSVEYLCHHCIVSYKSFVQTLYESSTALGFKRSDNIDQGKYSLLETIQNLELANRKLKQEVGFEISFISTKAKYFKISNMKVKIQMTESKGKEYKEVDRKLKKEELNFFRRTNQQLKSQIEAIMTSK